MPRCWAALAALLAAAAAQDADNREPQAGDVFMFNFTDWHGWSGDGIYSNMNDREYTKTALQALLKFYHNFEWDIDISGALGLFILKLHLESALHTIRAIFGSYANWGQNDYIYGIGNDTIIDPIQALLNKVLPLLEKFKWKMIARVPASNIYRRIASVFINNDDPWVDNNPQFDWYRTLPFPWRSANQWEIPDLDIYRYALSNASYQEPDINITNICLEEVAMHPVFHIQYPQRCTLRAACYDVVENGNDFGYALSHRLLLMVWAHFGRNCYYLSAGRDRKLAVQLCQAARLELDFLAQVSDFALPGLMMEFITFCTLYGYREFLRRDWLITLRQFQSKQHGCFCNRRSAAQGNAVGAGRSWWTLVRGDLDQVHNCDRHVTALAASTLGASLRSAVQPAYCSTAGMWTWGYEGYRYCYMLPNFTKEVIKGVPTWIKHAVLFNNYLQYHQGGSNDKLYEVYPTKVKWWQELPWLPKKWPKWRPWS